jgi:HNH endonuclease/AP2 domain
MRYNTELTQEELKHRLHYDTETGIFTWIRPRARRCKIGSIAGNKNHLGYRLIVVNSIRYLEHRLAFLYITGEWPGEIVDHINGNKSDNRWCNLRNATKSENGYHSRARKSNTSGFKGVYYSRKNRKWVANATINYKTHYLGIFDTREKAHEAYVKFATGHREGFVVNYEPKFQVGRGMK